MWEECGEGIVVFLTTPGKVGLQLADPLRLLSAFPFTSSKDGDSLRNGFSEK